MRIYLDTEFIERGADHPIELVSIGIETQKGDSFYIELADGWEAEHAGPWVKENVLTKLIGSEYPACVMRRTEAASAITTWLDHVAPAPDELEFWGYFCDYDWVVFCQLYGSMENKPYRFPFFMRDVQQLASELGLDKQMRRFNKIEPQHEHNALADAQRIRRMHEWTIEQQLLLQR